MNKFILFLFFVLAVNFGFAEFNLNAMSRRKRIEGQFSKCKRRKKQKREIKFETVEDKNKEESLMSVLKEEFGSEEDYIKSKKGEYGRILRRAERFFGIQDYAKAKDLYEILIDRYGEPLAFFRLGEIHKNKYEEEDNYNFDLIKISYLYYKQALEHGWLPALGKLLEFSEELIEIIKSFKQRKEKPMSEEVKRMYS